MAVSHDYFWLQIDGSTPRGVKLQLLTKHGVALHGPLKKGEEDNYLGWTPLPRRPSWMKG